MAIDTAEKRRSAAGAGFLPLGPGVTPNAAKDAEWRFQAAWGYSGIPITQPSILLSDVKIDVVFGALNTGAAATTDFTISNFGIPKAAKVTLTYDASDDADSASEYKICIGLTDFTNSRFISAQTEDASAAEDSNNRKGVNDGYFLITAAGGDDGHGDVSAITDGIRLTNQAAFSRAVFVEITLYGGTDLGVDCGTHSLTNTVVGNTNQQTTGIDQDIVVFIGLRATQEDDTRVGIKASYGIASTGRESSQSIVNRCQSFTVDDGDVVGDPFSAIRNNRCVAIIQSNGTANWAIELTAADATTFTTTVRDVDVNANNEVYYLALALDPEGTRLKSEVGSIDSPTASGNWSKNGLRFKPGYVEHSINRLTAENTVASDATAGSVGFSHNAGSDEETCHSIYDEDAALTINANNCFRSRAIYLFEDDAATIAYDLSHLSFNADGWTYSQVGTPNVTASKWLYLAIEQVAAAVITSHVYRRFTRLRARKRNV